jgi:hypothetical protein
MIKRNIEMKGAPKANRRATGFSISNFNITQILLSTRRQTSHKLALKRPKPGPSEEGPGFGSRSLEDRG